jgi:opacity protein-like surface antigen
MRLIFNASIFLLLFSILFLNNVSASWFYQTIITSSVEGDDNRRLLVNEDEGVVGAQIRSNFRLSQITETSRINFDGIWRSARFDGDADDASLDADDQEIRADGEWNSERIQYSINGSFLRQNTAVTELEDTGAFADIARRVTKSINPEASYSLTQTTSLVIGAGYTDVEFPGIVPVGLTEFDTRFANFGVTHNIDARTQLSLTYAYSIFESENTALLDTGNDIDTSSLNFRIDRSWAETWQIFAGLGFRKSNFSTDDGSGDINRNDDTGLLYDFGVMREFETVSINFLANRQTEPSAIGTLNERTTFRLIANKDLSERLSLNMNLTWLENKSVDDLNNTNDREFWSSTLGASFRLTRNWFITGDYRHRDQKFDTFDGGADANSDAIIIGIRFNGNEKKI